jgi:uncharacterized Zn finger protein
MYYGWKPYVPVAERRRKAEKELQKLAKKGLDIQPVRIQGRTIARTFWGKAWCAHLESFSDYANRLPRGRTYVRNGSVCHLEIRKGEVRAKVSGSSMYEVRIDIQLLKAADWERIKQSCTGQIQSLLDLLGGRLSDGVMAVVTDREKGLFPKPREIVLGCSCPDYATMCKHVAAVLYGVAARLDESPELLFTLRGVNHEELVTTKVAEAVQAVIQGGSGQGRDSRRRIAESDLADVFGVDIDDAPSQKPGKRPVAVSKADSTRKIQQISAADPRPSTADPQPSTADPMPSTARQQKPVIVDQKPVIEDQRPAAKGPNPATTTRRSTVRKAPPPEPLPKLITGALVRELREKLGLSTKDFAKWVGLSSGVISVWEHKPGNLNLHDRSRQALRKAWQAAARIEKKKD